MANILQVTSPSVNDNRGLVDARELKNHAQDTQVQNPVDPSKVVRADGQESGKTGTATGERVVDYGSNYGAFIQKLGQGTSLSGALEQLLFKDVSSFLFGATDSVSDLVQQMLSTIQVNSTDELVQFLKSQQQLQAKFSGKFFDGLRAVLQNSSSQTLKEAVAAFLKGYNDYASSSHLLEQMRSLTDDISRLMLRSYREDFQELLKSMNWDAEEGDTSGNSEFLNNQVIPFLSKYISRTHDYGAIRDATLLFIFQAVRYENGDGDKLQQLFERMIKNKEFMFYYEGDPSEDMQEALQVLNEQTHGGNFADAFSELLLRGANGEAGLENIQHFYSIINGMLLNESVYLPLMHLILPFQLDGKDVMSEMWVDPDAKRSSEEESRKIKMLLKFNVQNLGKFEMLLLMQDRQVDLQLLVPPRLMEELPKIESGISGILKQNGLGTKRITVGEKGITDTKVEDVFPEIREKERTINVRI